MLRDSGSGLIEMLVIILLLAILAACTSFKLSRLYQRILLAENFRVFLSDLRSAELLSMASEDTVSLYSLNDGYEILQKNKPLLIRRRFSAGFTLQQVDSPNTKVSLEFYPGGVNTPNSLRLVSRKAGYCDVVLSLRGHQHSVCAAQ